MPPTHPRPRYVRPHPPGVAEKNGHHRLPHRDPSIRLAWVCAHLSAMWEATTRLAALARGRQKRAA